MTRPAPCLTTVAAILMTLVAFSSGVRAESQPKPFAAGDAATGKAMTDKDCVACHARRFDGNAEKMYLRADRKVRTPEQLMAQVRTCNVQLGTKYFPEEEEHVAAYLNLQYYKFKP
jgi:cytochrome c5